MLKLLAPDKFSLFDLQGEVLTPPVSMLTRDPNTAPMLTRVPNTAPC